MNPERQHKSEIKSLLENPPRRITIITHVNPDGDAMGSSLGLETVLICMGHDTAVIAPNVYPEFLHWLPGNKNVLVYPADKSIAEKKISQAEVIFIIDFNDFRRVNQLKNLLENSPAFKVIIDHHPCPESRANLNITDVSVSSTAELVYQFIKNLELQKFINREVATCLFTGIMADTGCFSYNSSRKETYLAVSELLDYGIDKDGIYYKLYDNFTAHRMQLLGYALNKKMQVLPEYKTVFISLNKDELVKFDFQTGDSENFVNYPLSIKNICFSALFIERDDHVKISFRSKGDFAVNEFARKHFNGGGHLNAAGGESYTTLDKTLHAFRDLLPEYKEQLIKYEI
ncbi:MAG: bifunctional oligoribonuclease/PAP phosphatase NrnA [Bacteroidales bacterium]|nr:MAG: bifunctional oligoribonuclease/PAP phosphatase NrnA [Bacteroidales bacterium]